VYRCVLLFPACSALDTAAFLPIAQGQEKETDDSQQHFVSSVCWKVCHYAASAQRLVSLVRFTATVPSTKGRCSVSQIRFPTC
jgi:hypothetical protein